MTLLFLNGGGMRGGPLHDQLRGAPFVRAARSAAKYRYYAVGGRFPAMAAGGRSSVVGEVYDVPLAVLRDHLLPAEPPELELGVIELDDGTACLATVLRAEFTGAAALTDISDIGDWRTYLTTRPTTY
jgi:gamma-glutamylcyclotransferase (GGCT)/AIG2-like uncharacterized protein YtfP